MINPPPKPTNVTPIDLLSQPMREARNYAEKGLYLRLQRMFDNADDRLFDMADKAGSNEDQTLYFDSMREIRLKREEMEQVFSESFKQAFKALYQAEKPGVEQAGTTSNDSFEMAILDDEEVEERVAVKAMISKVFDRCADQLKALNQRFDDQVRNKEVGDNNNPLGPACLCDYFTQACGKLVLPIRAKLIVYKLFDKFVLGTLDDLYAEVNGLLVENGVLPQLKLGIIKKPSHAGLPPDSRSKTEGDTDSSAETGVDQAEVFSMLRTLLADVSPKLAKGGAFNAFPANQTLHNNELAGMLSGLQNPGDGQLLQTPVDIRTAVNALLEQQAKQQDKAIGRLDHDALNLVSMLFEFILDDHDLSASMKALLARLQIPLLKVAVLDKTFFSRGGHPARRLLNELAAAAMGWSEQTDHSRDKLYQKIQEVVDRVLKEFDENLALFDELLNDFTAFVGIEKQRTELIEKRTRDAEEGREKAQRARALVAHLLNEKAKDTELPEVVVQILREGWNQYLFLVLVKKGEESEAWSKAVATVDDLIWSVCADRSDTNKLVEMIPSLLTRLRSGLESISFSESKMLDYFRALEQVHLGILRPRKAEEPEQPIDEDAHLVRAQPSPVIVEQAPQIPVEVEERQPEEAEDEVESLVLSMGIGTWLEFIGDSEQHFRAKLAAIIRSTGKYIFVNRNGMKIAEYYRPELIGSFRNDEIKVIDNTLLFDRALESVIHHLREMKD